MRDKTSNKNIINKEEHHETKTDIKTKARKKHKGGRPTRNKAKTKTE